MLQLLRVDASLQQAMAKMQQRDVVPVCVLVSTLVAPMVVVATLVVAIFVVPTRVFVLVPIVAMLGKIERMCERLVRLLQRERRMGVL